MRLSVWTAALLGAGALCAQDRWEISAVGGGTFYRDLNASGTNPARAANVGFFDGAAAGVVVSQTGRQRWGGEFHYLFQTNNMRLRTGQGATGAADFAAQSHAFHYDVLLYANRRDARVRPFVAFGPGLKVYEANGQERGFRPLDNIVIFSRESEVKFMLSAGGGVKLRVHKHALVRLDFRDYVTGIPKNFTSFPGVRLSGQFHNFVTSGGIGIMF